LNLGQDPGDYKYSSARFYETEVDDPIAIRFGLLTHCKDFEMLLEVFRETRTTDREKKSDI
jgi:hypothetical protein